MVRRSTCSTFLLLGFLSSAALADGRAPAPPPPVLPWYDAVDLDAFVDAYGSVDWGFPKPQTTDGAPTRYHHSSNGFALSWVGLNMSYAPEPVGGTVSLRFGPTAPLVAGPAEPDSLRYVKQAFASFRPGGPEGALTLDFGKFDTPFGAEAAESQENFNYTHGVLWAAQPLFHTGLRARYDLAAELSLVGLVANGINRSVDNNVGKTFGLKAELALLEWLDVGVGWLGGPEQDDFVRVACAEDTAYEPSAQGCAPSAGAPARSYTVDRGGANEFEAWTHLFDLVVTANLAPPLRPPLERELRHDWRALTERGVPDGGRAAEVVRRRPRSALSPVRGVGARCARRVRGRRVRQRPRHGHPRRRARLRPLRGDRHAHAAG